MIDLHSHILPGMDDGSKDREMSLALLSLLRQQGVETVVATPHFYAAKDTLEDFLHRRAEAVDRLALDSAETPRILLGAEVAYFDGMSHSEGLTKLQLGDSRLLLVEMPFASWTERMIREICRIPWQTGLTPVLAHVNRYCHSDQFLKFKQMLLEEGILFQCNAEAFLNWADRIWALGQIKRGDIHFLGSDTHNLTTRAPQLDRAAKVIIRKAGQAALDEITAFSKDMLRL